jgi:hypothetical protein
MVPIPSSVVNKMHEVRWAAMEAIQIAKADWDSVETSWSFESNPLVRLQHGGQLSVAIKNFVISAEQATSRMCELENEISHHYLEAFGLGKTNNIFLL